VAGKELITSATVKASKITNLHEK